MKGGMKGEKRAKHCDNETEEEEEETNSASRQAFFFMLCNEETQWIGATP